LYISCRYGIIISEGKGRKKNKRNNAMKKYKGWVSKEAYLEYLRRSRKFPMKKKEQCKCPKAYHDMFIECRGY